MLIVISRSFVTARTSLLILQTFMFGLALCTKHHRVPARRRSKLSRRGKSLKRQTIWRYAWRNASKLIEVLLFFAWLPQCIPWRQFPTDNFIDNHIYGSRTYRAARNLSRRCYSRFTMTPNITMLLLNDTKDVSAELISSISIITGWDRNRQEKWFLAVFFYPGCAILCHLAVRNHKTALNKLVVQTPS